MKRFDFPLDKVRLWRHEQAELEQAKLQKMLAELLEIDGLTKNAEDELTRSESCTRDSPSVQAHELANLDSFRRFTGQLLQKIEGKRLECKTRVESQRVAVLEARRQAELLDKLKKSALAEWRAAQDKEQEELAAELFLAKRRREIRTSEN